MTHLKTIGMVSAVFLGCVVSLNAQTTSPSSTSIIRLQRDSGYEENLRYLASADTTVTPAKVLRWISSLMGHRPMSQPSNFEFQPVVRSHDHQQQIIAQLAYKF